MSSTPAYIFGIDIGATKVALCIASTNCEILANTSVPQGSYEQVRAGMKAEGERILKELNLTPSDIAACGICAPGPLDMENGIIRKSPNMVWGDTAICHDVQQMFGFSKVYLENDANAGVLVELYFGGAKGLKDVIYLTMSTGVGGGIIANGKLLTGKTGIAGELGHVILDVNGPLCGCGQLGCLEAYCGGKNVALRLQDKLRFRPNHAMYRLPGVDGKLENLNFQAVREGAKLGIPLAVEMWDEICFRLAQGIGIYMTTFNPEMIILGTAAYRARENGLDMLPTVMSYLPRFAWKEFRDACTVCITELKDIGAMAGAASAIYGLGDPDKKTVWN